MYIHVWLHTVSHGHRRLPDVGDVLRCNVRPVPAKGEEGAVDAAEAWGGIQNGGNGGAGYLEDGHAKVFAGGHEQ